MNFNSNLVRSLLVATAVIAAGVSAARAEIISPSKGLTATLDAVSVSVYYQVTDAGYRVVVTAGTQERGGVVRFVSTLSPGQSTVVSVPRGVGQPALELQLHRVGDQIELQRSVS